VFRQSLTAGASKTVSDVKPLEATLSMAGGIECGQTIENNPMHARLGKHLKHFLITTDDHLSSPMLSITSLRLRTHPLPRGGTDCAQVRFVQAQHDVAVFDPLGVTSLKMMFSSIKMPSVTVKFLCR